MIFNLILIKHKKKKAENELLYLAIMFVKCSLQGIKKALTNL